MPVADNSDSDAGGQGDNEEQSEDDETDSSDRDDDLMGLDTVSLKKKMDLEVCTNVWLFQ